MEPVFCKIHGMHLNLPLVNTSTMMIAVFDYHAEMHA